MLASILQEVTRFDCHLPPGLGVTPPALLLEPASPHGASQCDRPIAWRDIARIEVEGTVEVDGAAPTLVGPGGEALMASKQRDPLVNKQEAEIQLIEERDVLDRRSAFIN